MSALHLQLVDEQTKKPTSEKSPAPKKPTAAPLSSAAAADGLSPAEADPRTTRAKKLERPAGKKPKSAAKKPDPKATKSRKASPKTRPSASKPSKRETVAQDVMRSPALSCKAYETLNQAVQLMWEFDVGAVVVVNDEGHPVSMLTDRDVCMACYTQGVAPYHGTVSSAMSKTVVSCGVDTSIAAMRELMAEAQVRRLPVVDDEGKLVGIVGLSDLVREAHAPLPKDKKRGSTGAMLVQLFDGILQEG